MIRPILMTATRRILSNGKTSPVWTASVGFIPVDTEGRTRRFHRTTCADFAHRSFSTAETNRVNTSSSSLGIFDTIVLPHLDSLQTLPEVTAALSNPTDTTTIEGLTRAVQIFESMGGPMQAAVQGLLADAYQETGQYAEAIQVLEEMLKGDVSSSTTTSIQIGLSKALFYKGDFERALQVTSDLLDSSHVQSSIITRGSVLSSQGVIQLAQLQKEDEYAHGQEIIKVLRVAAKSLEGYGDAGAAAYNNLGVAQVVSELVFLDEVRVDVAMRYFHQALEMTGENAIVKGRIYNNMAQTLLMEDYDDEDLLKLASEYARDALNFYEKSTQLSEIEKQGGLGRSLNSVASCYIRADAAVTAEGLFQTAIDMPGVDPLTRIAQREVYRSYSELCRKWDKREADKERLEAKSVEINDSLGSGWKDQPGIMSGLLFHTG